MDTAVKYKIVEKIIKTEGEAVLQKVYAPLNMSETGF